jgi:adenine-specific DNA-methyltransferase
MINFTYMGTKKAIAEEIAKVILRCQDGLVLDMFAGMGAVAQRLSPERPVWCNDIQKFAHFHATCHFTSPSGLRTTRETQERLRQRYCRHHTALRTRYAQLYDMEREALARYDTEEISKIESTLRKFCDTNYRRNGRRSRYDLFTTYFSGSYLSLQQAIDFDSIRYSLDYAYHDKEILAEDYRWLILSLCKALALCSNSTGHFAQFLTVKEKLVRRHTIRRSRSLYHEWLALLSSARPIGPDSWRKRNIASNLDALALSARLRQRKKNRPSVVYADPPYTKDQYSRFYHLFETAVLYDYPERTGSGLYRQNRYSSPFCLKSQVIGALTRIMQGVSSIGADLVMSYPENGLLADSKTTLYGLLKDHFNSVSIAAEIPHKHSSLGASKGVEKLPVTEVIFVARMN